MPLTISRISEGRRAILPVRVRCEPPFKVPGSRFKVDLRGAVLGSSALTGSTEALASGSAEEGGNNCGLWISNRGLGGFEESGFCDGTGLGADELGWAVGAGAG